jgi:RHS repeat-associated protein
VSYYGYDALGRRVLTGGAVGQTLRTVYDGKGFEVIRTGETFRDGSLTTRYAPEGRIELNGETLRPGQATGERYRWLSDNQLAMSNEELAIGNAAEADAEGYTPRSSQSGGRGITLYARGEAVAMSYQTSTGGRSVYLGKDILGSVRSATSDGGVLEERYEYDAFGTPYQGDLSGGMNLGYTGKPYDTATGLYNYGFRDYQSIAARFTTEDPIRDGNNWFAYVNNDPVNWIDLWGLDKSLTIHNTDPTPGKDEIISSSGNVGHTWIEIDNEHYGWGWSSGTPVQGNTVPGAELRTKDGNEQMGAATSSYTKTVTDEQAQAVKDYFENLKNSGTGYNLGGMAKDPAATMCTEAVVEALNQANALTPAESAIINEPYNSWKDSFPSNIPSDYANMAPNVEDLTAPNPNAMEGRIDELNRAKNTGGVSDTNGKNH